ncbi:MULTISPECIES: type VII secretion-associated serine protease mycosin [Micromonospora]|uniref:Type VII secretion-associated serine protease mycosin n=1 Tax=Micromonospora solifontis TaxID=2487138 RepID=A0ABX9WGR6_9ACTN|nr:MULTISPECIES: type VII secretion-associated serine protease mycosin [Micromonospora]NES14729.1 type VII secretion-associated serine protease mycosin [Micromonospora sp. PPF5-17B]NES36710.1 type VII secretion-associated serine protease mycosin [Micromonospora solifontis]NES55737.1 type VII secretion-associated serine protease mycosin [Micromonospora sp. PPF5-6]RNL99171.1 type VII secretion-associated serine protease mycosin [Micromonospora solifontis]
MTRDRQGAPTAVRRFVGRALVGAAATLATVAGPVAPAAHAATVVREPAWVAPVESPARVDQVRAEQWQLDQLNARAAWRSSTGRGVVVAVVDSGVDGSHPDLAGQVLPGIDLVTPGGSDRPDPVGHGTTVAGLIAGRNDDDRGAVGLAPDAKILPVRVLDDENRYDDALIVAKGVRWAVDNGARVINLSLGGSGDSPALAAALDYAFARDVVVVACTGNLATSTSRKVWYPAREPGVIAVAGLERNGKDLWSGSITGHETTLTAPATALYGARPDGYWRVQGTSFAAPLVAATAALIRSRYPKMAAGDVVNRLISTAKDLGPTGRDDRFGYGLVDPVAALTTDVPSVGANPLDDNDSPGVVGFGPAPGADRAASAAAGQGGDPFYAAPRQPAKWSARAAGEPTDPAPERLWTGLALFVALVTGAALVIRRFRQARR